MSAPRSLRRAALAALACLAAVAASLTAAAVTAAPARAAVVGFNAANIIDDLVFYDGGAMTTSQVQSFLNQQSPNTSSGLRNYKSKTKSKAADTFCRSYAGKSSETAAQIIAKVGKACGISQKAILVTLQKETSLVTLSPESWRYDRAMGYACPDSGPNHTANCDTNYYGFFNQVYNAARQIQKYRYYTDFRYQKGKSVQIGYHPQPSCGSSSVKIQNYATAALYNYTPYQPNKAALNAGWGTGDSCSSYGNRNFYNFWRSWFGSVRASGQLTDSMQAAYDAAEDRGIELGSPTSVLKKITANGGGYQMEFEGGLITQSTKLRKSYAVHSGGWTKAYLNAGGASGKWGFLAGTQSAGTNGYKTLKFQNGVGLYAGAVGVQYMPNVIYSAWKANGGWNGPLGLPAKAAYQPKTTSASQQFEKATLMASGSASTVVSAAELSRWSAAGGYSAIGFYTAPAVVQGTRSHRTTEKGILFLPSSSKHLFIGSGAFTKSYLAAGGPAGSWGWPTTEKRAQKANGGSEIRFENGVAVHSKATGVTFLSQGAYDDWVSIGGSRAAIGFPAQDTQRLDGGDVQKYAKHYRFIGPKFSVEIGAGAFTRDYLAAGGPAGAWGWPISAKRTHTATGGSEIAFENGVAVYSKTTGVAYLPQAAYDDWMSQGGPSATIGYPAADATVLDDGYAQEYTGHYRFIGPEATIQIGSGAFTRSYLAAGGPAGAWGWPTAEKRAQKANGGSEIRFENGIAVHSGKTGVAFLSQAAYDDWVGRGGSRATIGFPVDDTQRLDGGDVQEYAKHYRFVRAAGTIDIAIGAFTRSYLAAGGPAGAWGWPTGAKVVNKDGSSRIPFENGVARYSAKTGVVFTSKP